MFDVFSIVSLLLAIFFMVYMHYKLVNIKENRQQLRKGTCQVVVHDFDRMTFINECISNLKNAKKSEDMVLKGIDTTIYDMGVSHKRDELLKREGALRAG